MGNPLPQETLFCQIHTYMWHTYLTPLLCALVLVELGWGQQIKRRTHKSPHQPDLLDTENFSAQPPFNFRPIERNRRMQTATSKQPACLSAGHLAPSMSKFSPTAPRRRAASTRALYIHVFLYPHSGLDNFCVRQALILYFHLLLCGEFFFRVPMRPEPQSWLRGPATLHPPAELVRRQPIEIERSTEVTSLSSYRCILRALDLPSLYPKRSTKSTILRS